MTSPHQPPAHCPHCGYSLVQDEPIKRDGFWIDLRGAVLSPSDDAPRVVLGLTRAMVSILHTLASSSRAVSAEILSERAGLTEHSRSSSLYVLICKMRRVFERQGTKAPILTVPMVGYQWSVA